jgi:N-dimethylarginine dimethylaminohydrolase
MVDRLLMCPPDYFDTHFMLNPWMGWDEVVNPALARAQWETLSSALRSAGAEIEILDPDPSAAGLVFTRDALLSYRPGAALVLRNDGARGELEPVIYRRWLRRHYVAVETLGRARRMDGGNVLPTTEGGYLVGLKPGNHANVARALAARIKRGTGARCWGIPLSDPNYLHLDMVLADLGGKGWLAYPHALGDIDPRSSEWRQVFGSKPIITVDSDEARLLACNVVVVGTVVVGALPDKVARDIEALGLEVCRVKLDEFRKAGGGAHCLTSPIVLPELD